MAAVDSTDALECQELCQETADCEWFTFHATDNVCLLTEDCQWLDTTCEGTCVHGPRKCDPYGEESWIEFMNGALL